MADVNDKHRISGVSIVADADSICIEQPTSEDLYRLARRLEAAAAYRATHEREERAIERQLDLTGDPLL
jgi:hypothetical protein